MSDDSSVNMGDVDDVLTPFEEMAQELMERDGNDIMAMLALHIPDDDGTPYAETLGTAPRQLVAVMLMQVANGLMTDAAGSQ